MPTFVPYTELRAHPSSTVVDAYHPSGWALSHWRGASQLPELHDDTSLGIVLNALKADHPSVRVDYVSNNHFDVDGFLGVWALQNPEWALAHETALREAALIGDFREYNPERPGAEEALQWVCWLNQVETREFYRPFGAKNEMASSVAKYQYFLPRLAAMIESPEDFRADWEPEYERVKADVATLRDPGQTQLIDHPDIRLREIRPPRPLHYYALFSGSENSDLVMSCYPGQRYELEYKYSTWVDTAHRRVFPRIDLRLLAERLNRLETAPQRWTAEGIMDTGPLLRLGGEALSKEERFAHPYQRAIHDSGLEREVFGREVRAFFQRALAELHPRQRWSWAEMQAVQPEW